MTKPWLKDALFHDTKTGDCFPVQSIVFLGDTNKTVTEFVHRCRLLKTENDCYATLTLVDDFLLIWDSTFIKEKIILSNKETTVEFTLNSEETDLKVIL